MKKGDKLFVAPVKGNCIIDKVRYLKDNDVQKTFDLLKQCKMEPIIQKTGVSIDEAFQRYNQCNGDIEKTIEN